MHTEKELEFMPITCHWCTAGNMNFIDFCCDDVHKAIRVSPKMETAMRHPHGRKINARRSELKHDVYMLLYCHTPITLSYHALEQDTSAINSRGETISPMYPLHKYLLGMMHKFIEEVANGQIR